MKGDPISRRHNRNYWL